MVSEWADSWAVEDFSNAYRSWMQDRMHAPNHGILFDILHDTEFTWSRDIPRDADRAADGRHLRWMFAKETGEDFRDEWAEWPCSFLEFLIALAFSIDEKIMYDPSKPDQISTWFWLMMENVGLDKYDDETLMRDGMLGYMLVGETTSRVMKRRYDYNGSGGLFPLRKPKMDQRKVEIWYQLNAYFIEEYFE